MTCRHGPGDLSCSKYGYGSNAPVSPDVDRFEVLDAQVVGSSLRSILVVKVQYPNCVNCAYEGVKILVYENVTLLDVIKWRRIDPHFRPPKIDVVRTSAPPPSARFPGSDEGWRRALEFAASIEAENVK